MSGVELFTIGKTAVTIADVALASGVALAGTSAIQGGRQAQKQADLQAQILDQNAEAQRKAAAADAAQFARDESRAAGRLRALVGGSGVRTGTGTPLAIEEDREAEAELQRLRILHGGEVAGSGLEAQARLERASGRAARTRGFREGAATFLIGGSRSRLLKGVSEEFGA